MKRGKGQVTVIRFGAGVAVAFGLSGCMDTTEGATVMLPPPPEYMACSNVARELAIADERVKQLGAYDTNGAYWAKRSERLVVRFYTCQKTRERG